MASSSSRAVLFTLSLLAAWAHEVGAGSKLTVDMVRPLVARLGSTEPPERTRAEKVLLEMGPDVIAPLLEILAQGNLAEVEPIRELLPKYGPEAIRALYDAGRRDFGGTGDEVMWNAAAEAVVRMGEPAVPVIVDWFTHPYGGLFSFSTQVLARMQEQGGRATFLLVPLLDDPTKEVRERAAAILANYPDPRAFQALLGALKSDDGVVQMYAAQGLGYLKNPAATEALLGLLHHDNMAMRNAVVGALGGMYTPRLRTTLALMARRDSAVMVRDVAANWLLRSKDPLAIRLGRRYKPIALSPARQGGIALLYSLMLGASFVVVLGVMLGSVFAMRRRESPRWVIAGLAALVLGAGGLLWGGVVPSVTAGVEHTLLLLAVPLAAAVACGIAIKRRASWPALAAPFGAFYVGYGLGWLWLWGHLGF